MVEKSKKKSKVISVRLAEETHTKFEDMRVKLEEINEVEISQPDLLTNMINFYHTYIESIDVEAIAEVKKNALVKALANLEK